MYQLLISENESKINALSARALLDALVTYFRELTHN